MMPSVILDCGSGTIKAGFSNEQHPLCVFSSVLGRPRSINNNNNSLNKEKNVLCGNAALKKRGLLSLRYPIEHGIIVNWDDMEQLLHHTFFNELRIDPQHQSVFLTEAPLNPRANREKSTQVLFESFDVNSIYMASQSVLGLYSYGRTIGMVIESGEGVTHSVPIFEGYTIPQAILRLDLGGRDVTEYLAKLLTEKGHKFFTVAEKEVVKDIKEKMCFVSQDYDEDIAKIDLNINDDDDGSNDSNSSNQEENNDKADFYELPDGNNIKLENERFRAPEILFQPKLVGSEQMGLTKLINESVMKCEIDIRRLFWNNIILTGGNTMFNGLTQRLNKDLSKNTPISVIPKISTIKNRNYCVWRGAAILANLPSFQDSWFTKEEWKENGPSRIHAITPF